MKGKIPKIVMLVVVLAMAMSLVAGVTTTVGADTDRWSRQDLPTTYKYQMFPDSDIWDLTAADDGTLFALVEDTTGAVDIMGIAGTMTWDGLRWAIFPEYSDVALFKSTDGGYEWTLMWHIPSSEDGAPIAVVPQPGYDGTDADNQVIFIACGSRYQAALAIAAPNAAVAGGLGTGNIYRSMGNGGSSFTRITPRCPAVSFGANAGTITSIDVVEDMLAEGKYMAVVGVSSLFQTVGNPWPSTGSYGEGVWTWNRNGLLGWDDMQVCNALPPAPFTGTMPAGNGLDVIQVMASPTYATDGQIMAVLNDNIAIGPDGSPVGIYVAFWDGIDGIWGGDPDSPTTAVNAAAWNGDYADAACMDVADDHTKVAATVFVGLDGCGTATNNDVWRVRGLTTVSGPSSASATRLQAVLVGVPAGPLGGFISDIIVKDPVLMGTIYVGCEFPGGQAQVFVGANPSIWPTWSPSMKPPSGAWPVLLADGDDFMAAGGGDGYVTSGVHVMVDVLGLTHVFNGRGLLDDIAVSEDIPSYANPVDATTWCLAEAVYEEVSPEYAEDGTLYVGTFSDWLSLYTQPGWANPAGPPANLPIALSLWRWQPGGSWERVMIEGLTLPRTTPAGNFAQFAGKPMLTNVGVMTFTGGQQPNALPWTWAPRVNPDFSTDPYMFLLGGLGDSFLLAGPTWVGEMLWNSLNMGDAWANSLQMPIGALPAGAGLSETGWWVQDNSLVFLGDVAGFVYKTTDRGASWTEGALTALGREVSSIQTSPIYSETGESDQCLLVGTFCWDTGRMEVWISQDGAIADLENVGAEINTDPAWVITVSAPPATETLPPLGMTVVNFDADWGTDSNNWVYAAGSGWLDRWQLIGPGATELTRIDYSDVSVCRAEVNLDEPSASTWEKLWDADDFNAEAIAPKPLALTPAMTSEDVVRLVVISDLRIGHEGTIYAPFALGDHSYNFPGVNPTPKNPFFGRFTLGGVLRCLDGTQPTTEWNAVAGQDYGMGRWDGLWLARVVPGSNIIISLAFDWREWRFKLATYDDTLCQAGPALTEPADGASNVGEIVGEEVNLFIEWDAVGTTAPVTYQWQVDDDSGFTAPLLYDDMTTETFAELANLENGFEYFWRVRVIEPVYSPWSGPDSFTTTITGELGAPVLESPAAGAENVALQPTFEWSSVAWADTYALEVATDSSFSSTVIDETLSAQAYQSASDLEENTTYYWRVKGSSATQDSSWSATGIFTTGPPPAEEGAGTPAWVWVVIVIGAILAIAVIVLIVRTRRPV